MSFSHDGVESATEVSSTTASISNIATPLRPIALTVEERVPGEFRWSIIESAAGNSARILATSQACFAAYDTALATGYGELQRLIGPELQYGPRDLSPGSYQPSRVPEVAARLDGKTLPVRAAGTTLAAV